MEHAGDGNTVVLATRYFPPAHLGGGPVQSLGALVTSAPDHYAVGVVTSSRDLGAAVDLPVEAGAWTRWNGTDVRYVRRGLRSAGAVVTAIRSRRPDWIYVNSFFDTTFAIIPQFAALVGAVPGRPRIAVAPRGEFSKGALALKSPKKRVYMALYRALRLHRRVLWHATSDEEAEDVRREFGQSVTVVVRENETSLDSKAVRRADRHGDPDTCRLVFVSRLAPKKGLHTLLEALAGVDGRYDLRVIGAFEESAYRQLCMSRAAALGDMRVVFEGPATRDEVLTALAEADALVLPTAGENFGHIIAEALSRACPVICSDHTPWSGRLRAGGGLVVDPNTPDAWAAAISGFIGAGSPRWAAASEGAADAFDEWATAERGEHLFDLLLKTTRSEVPAKRPL